MVILSEWVWVRAFEFPIGGALAFERKHFFFNSVCLCVCRNVKTCVCTMLEPVHAKDALCLWALSTLTTRHSITDTVTANDNVRAWRTPLHILENSSQSIIYHPHCWWHAVFSFKSGRYRKRPIPSSECLKKLETGWLSSCVHATSLNYFLCRLRAS